MTNVDENDATYIQKELLEIIVKAGRRCAYDLAHAADQIHDKHYSEMYNERSKMWLTIFNPANGPKNYSNRLHNEIERLERRIERLRQVCIEEGNISEQRLNELTYWEI